MAIKRIITRMSDMVPAENAEDFIAPDRKIESVAVRQLGMQFESAQLPICHEFDGAQYYKAKAAEQEAYQAQLAQTEKRKTQEAFLLAEQKRLAEEEKQKLLNEQAQKTKQAQFAREDELRKKAQAKAALMLAKKEKKQWKKSAQKKRQAQGDYSTFSLSDFFLASRFVFDFNFRKVGFSFAVVSLMLALGIGGIAFAQKGLALKGKVLGASQDGYANLTAAANNLAEQNFATSGKEFTLAYENFAQASDDLNSLGSILVDTSRFVPFASKLASGKNAAEAGKHIAAALRNVSEVVQAVSALKNSTNENMRSDVSLLDVFGGSTEKVQKAKEELALAKDNLDKINIDDLPQDKREKFLLLKQKLPFILKTSEEFLGSTYIVNDLLGGNGPRKYLFLFQNNAEMRATGGFIGSYGLLDISQGHVRNFFIDGIFNPDGQLKAKVVPPVPIQKISAAWSLHDSNWFPDFPTSAHEAINFYEKTGGPTVDGVITLTPTVLEKLLAITGSVEMPEYDVTLTADNFVEKTQYEVEAGYDKEENKPKKILSDLAPLLLEKILNSKDMGTLTKAAQALSDGLREKHILIYTENKDLQQILSKQGWTGEILPAKKDYLSVINTNINGFKTDAVVTEKIQQQSEIGADGTIVDTVTITRHHDGGSTDYEWWNKVNADYMRVYVPQGSKLLEVSGQTREVDAAPLDYAALGFKKDELVEKEEASMTIDEQSGTRIWEDAGKTVFANWTYVSPDETMTITYKYLLPFKLFQLSFGEGDNVDSYSLVVQKQAGSKGSDFAFSLHFPDFYEARWNYPDNARLQAQNLQLENKLTVDQFVGVVFKKKH